MNEQIKKRISAINSGIIPDGYKKTKVGIVPVEWEVYKMGNICEINRGGSPRPIEEYLTTEKNGINWIKIGDTSVDGKYITSTKEMIKPDGVKKSRRVNEGDFLLSNSMSYGRPYILKTSGCIHDGWLVISNYDLFYNLDFFYYLLCHDCIQMQYDTLSSGSGVQNLNKELVSQVTVIVPPLPEQQKIAEILSTQDKLIELQERKIEQLKTLKKGYLQKMFPKKGCKYPELRFKGFTDPWEQLQFGNLFTIMQNNTLSRAELSEYGYGYTVHYGDVLIKYGETLDIKSSQLSCISSENILTKYKSSFLQDGDIIIADTAEDETVGKCTEISGIEDKAVVSGLHTIPCRPQKLFASGYLGYYMNSGAYHDQLLPLMQGTKVTSISKSALQGTILKSPESQEEQEYISNCFNTLDRLITLHHHKLDKEKQKKKALMQLLLTGKVRVIT